MDERMFTANIGISIKHNYLHITYNMLDFEDLGEAWHAIWSGHRRRGFPQIPKIQNIVIHM